MKLPNKIGIVDTTQAKDSRLRFDTWEGYDSIQQRKFLALKINEIIDFLAGHPSFSNEYGTELRQEGEGVAHVHEWRLNIRLGTRALYDCKVCGEVEQRLISPTQSQA